MREDQHTDEPIRTDDPDVFQPVPVKLDPVQVGAPEFGNLSRFFGIGPGQPVQVLPAARKRKRASIKCNAVSGGGALAIVGSLGQVGNGATGAALSGYALAAGDVLEYTAQQALYVICDTAAQSVNISVVDERYR